MTRRSLSTLLPFVLLVAASTGCRGTGVHSPAHTPHSALRPSLTPPHVAPTPPATDFRPIEIAPTPRHAPRPTPAPAPPAPAADYFTPRGATTPPAPAPQAPTLGVSHEADPFAVDPADEPFDPAAPRLLPGLSMLKRLIGRGTPVAYESAAAGPAVALGPPVFDRG